MAVAALSLSRLSLASSSSSVPSTSGTSSTALRLSSSQSFAINPFNHVACGGFSLSEARRSPSVIIAAAAPTTKKKVDSAVKRARQAEKRRMYNRSRKSEIHTRMKKVFVALDSLKKQADASEDMLPPVETLIAEAFSTIDKAVKVGTLHRNTGARRKSRLSRAKRAVAVKMGWYAPSPSPAA